MTSDYHYAGELSTPYTSQDYWEPEEDITDGTLLSDKLTHLVESTDSLSDNPHFIPAIWPQYLLDRFQSVSPNKDNSAMANVPAPQNKPMPSRNHHSMPKFDGKPASLSIFLDNVKRLAEASNLMPRQTIDWAIQYAPNQEHELWRFQEAVGMDDWDQFK